MTEGPLSFPRSMRPPNPVGGPMIVAFSDRSFQAYSAVVYLRWELAQEDAETVEGVGVNGVPSCDVDEVDGVEYVTDDDQGVRKFYVQLLCAKSRVTPLLGLTIPRAELCGVVLASRLALSVAKTLSSDVLMKPSAVILLSDSECCISALNKSPVH